MQTIIIAVILFALWLFFSKTPIVEKFSDVIRHGVFVTEQPPTLHTKPSDWKDHYTKQARHNLHKAHSNLLLNYPPMEKPPAMWEATDPDTQVDVARAQFVPMMEKRKDDRPLAPVAMIPTENQ